MSTVVTYIIQALDQFSGTYNKMNATLATTDQKIADLNKRMSKTGEGFRSLAYRVSLPLAAFGTFGINEFLKEKKALDSFQDTLTKLGNKAPYTFDQFNKAAQAIETKSVFQADDVLGKVTNKLLLLGTIAPENLMKAQEAIVNFAAKFETDLPAATAMFARALQNPVQGTRFLEQRLGRLDPELKKLLKHLMDTGQSARAQGILLEIFGSKLAGAAEKAKENQPFTVMFEAVSRVATEIGRQLLPGLLIFVKFLENLSYKFAALSPQTKSFITWVGLTVAALPILGFALTKIAVAVGAITLAFKALLLSNPLGWAIIAIGAFTTMYNKSTSFKRVVHDILNLFKEIGDFLKNTNIGVLVNKLFGNQETVNAALPYQNIGGQASAISGNTLHRSAAYQNILNTPNSQANVNMLLTIDDEKGIVKKQELKSDGPMTMNVGKNMMGNAWSQGGY